MNNSEKKLMGFGSRYSTVHTIPKFAKISLAISLKMAKNIPMDPFSINWILNPWLISTDYLLFMQHESILI